MKTTLATSVSVKQAAALLNLSISSVYLLIDREILPAEIVDGHWTILQSDLELPAVRNRRKAGRPAKYAIN